MLCLHSCEDAVFKILIHVIHLISILVSFFTDMKFFTMKVSEMVSQSKQKKSLVLILNYSIKKKIKSTLHCISNRAQPISWVTSRYHTPHKHVHLSQWIYLLQWLIIFLLIYHIFNISYLFSIVIGNNYCVCKDWCLSQHVYIKIQHTKNTAFCQCIEHP
jgi:hypothetical protein